MIGQRLGHFRIIRKIANGGMGVVYEATHEDSSLRVAVKVLFLAYAQDSAHASRFLQEARLLSQVQHAGLVRLFDFGQLEDGTVYMMMEYLDGQTLRARLHEKGKLSPTVAVSLIRQMALALKVVHQASIIHRDLTPANVMLVSDFEFEHGERTKILDFGIAKFLHDSTAHTVPGTVVGTARYMSPEQCQGQALAPSSDVYSLGIILFEALTGAWPYDANLDDSQAMRAAHCEQQPASLRKYLPDAPSELAALINQMLDKEPSKRSSMAEVAERLSQLPSRIEVDQTPVSKRPPAAATETAPQLEPHKLAARPPRKLLARILGAIGVLIGGAQAWRAACSAPAERRPAPTPDQSTPPPPRDLSSVPAPIEIAGMTYLLGGTYMMGSTPGEISAAIQSCLTVTKDCRRELYDREQPRHRVTVPAYYLDTFEVTNQRYADWLNMKTIEYEVKGGQSVTYEKAELLDVQPQFGNITYKNGKFTARPGFADRPVTRVSWLGATQFCHSAGRRLPTEEEWEYAARGGGLSTYPWGDDLPRCNDVSFFCNTQDASPAPHPPIVGKMAQDRSVQGVHDLAGSVGEWVQDIFVELYPFVATPAKSPSAAKPDASNVRVVRGGNYLSILPDVRAAVRSRLGERNSKNNIGFRCALSAGAKESP